MMKFDIHHFKENGHCFGPLISSLTRLKSWNYLKKIQRPFSDLKLGRLNGPNQFEKAVEGYEELSR